MKDLFKIVVFVLERLLHFERPLFDKPKIIKIYVSDGIRRCYLKWDEQLGVRFVDINDFRGD